jgi:uncharacterized membrane protein
MADEPEDNKPEQPAETAIPTPFTTAAEFSALARETLYANTNATLQVAALAREALVVGLGLFGTIAAHSAMQASGSFTSAGVNLTGKISASISAAKVAALPIAVMGGTIAAKSGMLSSYLAPQYLAGEIKASSGAFLGLSILMRGTAIATSSAKNRTVALALTLAGGEISAKSAAKLQALGIGLNIAGTIAAGSSARLFDPYTTDHISIGGTIRATSSMRLSRPFGQYQTFVTLNLS